MALSTQPYKGTRDFYPEDKRLQDWMFGRMRAVVSSYGYQPYDGPMLEAFELYAAKTGSEIVNEQLYSFTDRGERKIAVRPEMTPTLARMVAAKIHEVPRPIRWFSIPNLWRYERPQRGRLREHWQLNVDVLGGDALLADAEVLNVAIDLITAFGGAEWFTLKVNNRRLMDHVFTKVLGLDATLALQVSKLIDLKAKLEASVFTERLGALGLNAKQREELMHFFSTPFAEIAQKYPCEGMQELVDLFAVLKESGTDKWVVFDPTVVRGMDYYTGTVFEAYDTSPENNRAMFGGGRYDNLVGLFVSQKLSGVGFGLGDVTLRNFLETHKLLPDLGPAVDVLVTVPSLELRPLAETLSRNLRSAGLRVITPLSVEGFGAHLKVAAKHGARFAVLLGANELARQEVGVKNLSTGEQSSVRQADLAQFLKK